MRAVAVAAALIFLFGLLLFGLALGETIGVIAGLVDGVHELGNGDGAAIVEDRGLAAGEIDFDFMDAGIVAEGLLNSLFAFMAVHALDANDSQLIVPDILRHKSHSESLVPPGATEKFAPGQPSTFGLYGKPLLAMRQPTTRRKVGVVE